MKNQLSGLLLVVCSLLISLFATGNSFAQSWTDLPPMVHQRVEATVVQYNDDLYVFNGFGEDIKIEPSVERYDAATQSWSVIGSTSVLLGNAVTHNGTVRVGDQVWFIGGRKGSHPGQVSDEVWIYNLNTGSWTRGPLLPAPVASGGAALVNNRIHWLGGLDTLANCDVDHHFVYDLSKPDNGWQDISSSAPVPSPRNHFATAVLNGSIYIIGGQYGHDNCPGTNRGDTNLVHAYNPLTGEWVQKANLPSIQSHAEPSTFVYRHAIYVAGGKTQANKIFRYNDALDQWDTVGDLPERLLAPIARVVDDELIVASGGTPGARSPSARSRSTNFLPMVLPGVDEDAVSNDDSDNISEESVTPDSDTTVTEGEAYISIEAEYFDTNSATDTHEWLTTSLANSSNDAAVTTYPDSGAIEHHATSSPELGYLAVFDRPGTWYVWVRGWGNTNSQGEGNSDSLHAGLNGQLSTTGDKIDYFPAGWNWSNSTRDSASCLLYTSPSPRDRTRSRMPSSA